MKPFSFSEIVTRTVNMPYLFRTPQPKPASPAGLVVFLHGAGGKNTHLSHLMSEPIFAALPHLDRHGLCLAIPQCPAHRSGWPVDDLRVWLSKILVRHALDSERVIFTGVSMGGRGCWEFSRDFSDKLAALIPLCGPGVPNLASRQLSLPTRIFHGQNDNVVPVARSREMLHALRQAGAEATLEELPESGHDIGCAVYERGDLWTWAARQTRTISL